MIGIIGRSWLTIAGAFVRFLVASHGEEQFRRLYELTPFSPGERIQYHQACHRSVYRVGLAEFARQ